MSIFRSLLRLFTVPSRPRRGAPYTRRPLLTPAELKFYRVLLLTLPKGLTLMAKVRLMDLVQVPQDAWQTHGAPASGKHVDFVLADPTTATVKLVIELDDKSHARKDRKRRDQFVDLVLKAAGIPVLRVKADRWYEQSELRELVERRLRQAA